MIVGYLTMEYIDNNVNEGSPLHVEAESPPKCEEKQALTDNEKFIVSAINTPSVGKYKGYSIFTVLPPRFRVRLSNFTYFYRAVKQVTRFFFSENIL